MGNQITKSAAAMFFNSAGAVLLGLRSPTKTVRPSVWDFVGGYVERNESPEEALIRECQEEVGVRPHDYELIAIYPEPEPQKYGDASHYVYSVTNWVGSHLMNKSKEHSELRWFSTDEMRLLKNIADTRYSEFAELALNRRAR
jgi:8-oxo-dGTP diphosphatase